MSPGADLAQAERQAIREAAFWYARLASGTGTAADQRDWQRWHDADPVHRQAWRRVEAVRERFAGVPGPLAGATLRDSIRTRRQVLSGLALLVSATALGGLGWHSGLGRHLLADYRTTVGERRTFTLADGSRLQLDTDSAVSVLFDGERRLLRLEAGALLVDTGTDPHGRPFHVQTPHGWVRALGTRFTVRLDPQSSLVAVLDKAVEVQPRSGGARQRLEAGEQLRLTASALSRPQPNDPSVGAWAQGSLIVIDRPLSEVLDELTRYRHGWLRCDPQIAGLKVSGAFPLDDTDRALAALENAFSIQVVRRTRYWVTVHPRS